MHTLIKRAVYSNKVNHARPFDAFGQGHPTDRFGGISVRREMSSRAFLINAFCFPRDKNDVLGTKIGQLGFSERQLDLRFREMDKITLINSGRLQFP